MKAFIVVLDSVGIGAAPDADAYGDKGASTLGNLSSAVNGLDLPTLQRMGLGNIPGMIDQMEIKGVKPAAAPIASWGAMKELSKGKDTTTGHWEIAGLLLEKGFHLFPHDTPSFPAELLAEFERRTKRKSIGNKAASGTAIIDELGPRQLKTGEWIVYTSADSVFQIAAHEDIIPLEELYLGCRIAREICDRYSVGRVIARPYIGTPGAFKRTENRRDFSFAPPEPTILELLHDSNIHVVTVGKLDDIFCGKGINESFHVENNKDAQSALLKLVERKQTLFVFANLIDFDMLYGHRRDTTGYARALEDVDGFLSEFINKLGKEDILIITADHGNDPTFKGTDHTREYVPLIVYRPDRTGISLGIRNGFYDIARSLATYFNISAKVRGKSFLQEAK